MSVYALTGGIGGGKSTVAAMFRNCGAYTVDADELARQAVTKGSPALAQIAAHFGAHMLTADAELNRAALADLVFNDLAAKEKLEQIIHPAVKELAKTKFTQIYNQDPNAIIIYEIPLLVETKQQHDFAGIIVVHANMRERLRRLSAQRAMTEEQAKERISNQASDAERLQVADWIVHTDCTIAKTQAQVEAIWQNILSSQ